MPANLPSKRVHSADHALLIQRTFSRTDLLAHWPAARLAELTRVARVQHHVRGANLMAADPKRRELLVVVTGLIEVSTPADDGRRYMHSFIAPGVLAAVVRLLEGGSAYEYHAHVDSQVIHLPADAVIATLDREPILWKEIALLGWQRNRDNMRSLHGQHLEPPRQRLARALVTLAHQTRTRIRDGAEMAASISQADLAAMVGVTRQTMNQELRRLHADGIACASYKRITILDAKGLRRVADGG